MLACTCTCSPCTCLTITEFHNVLMHALQIKDPNTPVPFTHDIFLSEKELRGEVGPLGEFCVMNCHRLAKKGEGRLI